ncbi:Lysine transporter LysE [Vibrio jasicida]|uniref:LysE family translocator n=1 Tax=Vibrio jasicida TaxID=766224 RepID=UPI0028946E78|nr:Lysine transporter LysE [Vibrio jasicida]CAH1607142.1 Lysine transporter LysE [Vibrio jasicida]
MSIETILLFIPICFSLNLTPGPNNLMALNNGKNHGLKMAVAAGVGRLCAFVILIIMAASGLAIIVYSVPSIFDTIKLFGAAYIVYLAIKIWRSDVTNHTESQAVDYQELRTMFSQEFWIAASNPKAILIFTAFFPQFIVHSDAWSTQFFILGIMFLILELGAISVYAVIGMYLKTWFEKPTSKALFNRVSAVILSVAGLALLLSEQQVVQV